MEQVIAVDPGGTTGLVRWQDVTDIYEAHQLTWEDTVRLVHGWLVHADEADFFQTTIVVERYTITMQTLKKSRQYEALYCIGGLLTLALLHEGVDVVLQTPAEAKGLASDDTLRRLGWYDAVRGKEHARDALRHLVLFLVKTGRMNPSRLIGTGT